ncbi:MAG: RlmE family RNA methyltransferase [Gammaproteobacteria bacterium]
MGRRGSSGRWLERQARDPFVKKRRKQGYRSRAAFKLEELNRRDGLLKPGSRVIDLGAAPGGWTQVATEICGPKGTVVAVDCLKMEPVAGAIVIEGDCRDEAVRDAVREALGGAQADLVMSDMAPNMSGIDAQDDAAAVELANITLSFAESFLRRGGTLVIKLFQSNESDALVAAIGQRFKRTVRRKPPASRAGSREFYIVAQQFGI